MIDYRMIYHETFHVSFMSTIAFIHPVAKPACQFGHAMLIFSCLKAVKTMNF